MTSTVYTDEQEAQWFGWELKATHRRFPHLPIAEATVLDLLSIYRRLEADLPPFVRLLRHNGKEEAGYVSILVPHLDRWLRPDDGRPALLAGLLYLDAKGAEAAVLMGLKELPDYLATPDHLGILRSAPPMALQPWIDFQRRYGSTFSPETNNLAFRFLLDLFFHDRSVYQEYHLLADFLREILPLFQEKFPNEELRVQYHRVADWVKLCFQHREHNFPHLPPEDELYQMPIANIVQFIPGILWWNNGIPYQRGRKAFGFHSMEFRWLALGNSLRKTPQHPPYSKAMARAFQSLPYDLNTHDGDVYTYCLVLSLGGNGQLGRAVTRYFTRPGDVGATADWRQMMDPLVQKLISFRNFNWESDAGDRLLGYLYHIFRDQPDYPLEGRTQNSLLRDAQTWYDRIEERQQEVLARQVVASAAREESLVKDYWPGLKNTPEWSEEFGRYDEVRARKIVELTTESQLRVESRVLSHCVSTYASSCKNGQCSIWSLRELRQNGSWHSILTIQVIPRSRQIVQIRGRMNRAANQREMSLIASWAKLAGLQVDPGWLLH